MRLHKLGLVLLVGIFVLPVQAFGDDTEIARQLSESLQNARKDGQLQGFRLGVKVEDGTVWIKGRVANESQRSLALDKARRISGVKLVVNDIRLGNSAPVVRSQSAMAPVTPAPIAPAVAAARTVAAVAGMGPGPAPIPSQAPAPVPVANSPVANSPIYERPMPVRRQPPMRPQPGYRMASRPMQPVQYIESGGVPMDAGYVSGEPMQAYGGNGGGVSYEQPQMPGYAWPSYAAHPNYAGVTYPKQYSPMAWPYIGPFHPYPQVPLGWRKVTLEWDDGWWMLDFKSK